MKLETEGPSCWLSLVKAEEPCPSCELSKEIRCWQSAGVRALREEISPGLESMDEGPSCETMVVWLEWGGVG